MTDKQKIGKLKDIVESLCECICSLPSGCAGCWYSGEDNPCEIEEFLADLEDEE